MAGPGRSEKNSPGPVQQRQEKTVNGNVACIASRFRQPWTSVPRCAGHRSGGSRRLAARSGPHRAFFPVTGTPVPDITKLIVKYSSGVRSPSININNWSRRPRLPSILGWPGCGAGSVLRAGRPGGRPDAGPRLPRRWAPAPSRGRRPRSRPSRIRRPYPPRQRA